jgi:integrase
VNHQHLPTRVREEAVKSCCPNQHPILKCAVCCFLQSKRVAELLGAIDSYQGFFATKCALRLARLVFVRPGELRKAQWPEIDLDKAEWRSPAEHMKIREHHIIPLARQAIKTLRELEPLTNRPMPVQAKRAALRFPQPTYARAELSVKTPIGIAVKHKGFS